MKKFINLLAIFVMSVFILAKISIANAGSYEFWFSEEDLWNHTTSADSRLYNQDAPRRHHINWKTNVQTTDSTQPNQNEYQGAMGKGTNGWFQTATYESWLAAGPLDNDGNPFGIAAFNLWGAGYPNGSFAWNERYRVAAGAGAWQILATPTGWTGSIIDNPWPDNGNAVPLDQYFIEWTADEYSQRILYNSLDGKDDYLFGFRVDIIGEYPTTLEPYPDGNPFEDDGSLRIWFGGLAMNSNNEWTNEGYDAVMELQPIPEPSTWLLLFLGLVGMVGIKKKFR